MFRKGLVFLVMPALILSLLFSGATASAAFADDGVPPAPTPEPVVIRQGGPVIHDELAVPSRGSLLPAAAPIRRGWTDAFWVWYPVWVWTHNGSHNSQSDLVENNIWADGNLTIKGVVVSSCSKHTSGQYAQCGTSKTLYEKLSFTAKSWHFFHKTGYADTSFTTAKTLNP